MIPKKGVGSLGAKLLKCTGHSENTCRNVRGSLKCTGIATLVRSLPTNDFKVLHKLIWTSCLGTGSFILLFLSFISEEVFRHYYKRNFRSNLKESPYYYIHIINEEC